MVYIRSQGIRTTVGLPGTGLSYTRQVGFGGSKQRQSAKQVVISSYFDPQPRITRAPVPPESAPDPEPSLEPPTARGVVWRLVIVIAVTAAVVFWLNLK